MLPGKTCSRHGGVVCEVLCGACKLAQMHNVCEERQGEFCTVYMTRRGRLAQRGNASTTCNQRPIAIAGQVAIFRKIRLDRKRRGSKSRLRLD
jgi:hypothetical protein